MLELGFFVLSLICVWVVVRPLLVRVTESGNEETMSEILVSEKVDLERFLKSLEFEHARGLISEDEFKKQVDKVQKRLTNVG